MERHSIQTLSWQRAYGSKEALTAFSMIAVLSIAAIFFFASPYTDDTDDLSFAEHVALPETEISTLNKPEPSSHINVVISYGDTFLNLANKQRIPKQITQQILADPLSKKYLRHLQPYQNIQFTMDKFHNLTDIDYHFEANKKLHVHRIGDFFTSNVVSHTLQPRVHYAQATIRHSLFVAGARAGLSDNLIYQLTNYLAWDIDFARDIQPGDRFSVMYNDYYLGDRKVQNGNILAASFTCKGETYNIVRYTDPEGNAGYYTPNGLSVHKSFLRAPLHYTRISSPFNLHRMHPMLHRIRKHVGVDYVAPYGTPIKATSNGRVAFIGRKGGYGNTIMLQHGKIYTTVYAHLSRFRHGLHQSTPVRQGEVIGYVGSTGLATGPHVHYEFRVNGQHVDPVHHILPRAKPIDEKYRHAFISRAHGLLAQLNLYKSAVLASSSSRYPVG